MSNLLLEIGTEELPSSYIAPALSHLCAALRDMLAESRLGAVDVASAATPRRLVAFAKGVAHRQDDLETEVVGPPKHIAFAQDGTPTKQGLGFARSQGVDVAQVYFKETPKGAYCAAKKRIEGRPAAKILAEGLPQLIAGLPFPKSMHWLAGAVRFARPIRNLVALLDTEVIPFELAGVQTGRDTHGHPFLCPGRIELACADFDAYVQALREHNVIVQIPERKRLIREALQARLAPHGAALTDEALLEDVVHLVECPAVLEGRFDERYLQLPPQVVVEAMREHQKYFAVYNAKGALENRFLAVINRTDAQVDSIRTGNERVLDARLADAEFFWREDTRTRLEAKVEKLRDVLFQDRLGSYLARTERLEALVQYLGRELAAPARDVDTARRAARLAKADLVALMVGEFPKLQGTMGKLYALHDGEPPEAAEAIAEHYLPRHANDRLPQTLAGTLVSLADRFDALTGLFSIGLAPTGSQDPYALRRQAQGLVRILRSEGLSLSLTDAIDAAQSRMPTATGQCEKHTDSILQFLRDRIYQMALDEGRRYDVVNAVLASGFDDVRDAFARLEAVTALSAKPQWPALVTVVERTYNLGKNCPPDTNVDPALFEQDDERHLWERFERHGPSIASLIESAEYGPAAIAYHDAFAQAVHEFFDRVFVNVDKEALRKNRLAMLRDINSLFSDSIADLSQIVEAQAK